MGPTFVYPGSFCPPTFGHLYVVRKAAEIFEHLIIICSTNPKKENNLFTPQECVGFWRSYHLPKNVTVLTLDEFKQKEIDPKKIIMVRGIRDDKDFDHEKEVITLNYQEIGINKYFYLMSDDVHKEISSSRVRQLVAEMQLEKLGEYVSPMIISRLLEKFLGVRNIFMVIGKPGSGKSTFLKMLTQKSDKNVWINTDEFSKKLKSLLKESFGECNLINLALDQEEKMKNVIKKPWLDLLKVSLEKVPRCSNVFVEIPYGLQSDKNMFRFVGGKLIYIGCGDENRNVQRIIEQGTPELVPFVQKIPGLEESIEVAKTYNLSLEIINTDCSLEQLEIKAEEFNCFLSERKL